MNNRQKFIDYVKNGAENPICSPQIGSGAGYDSKIVGKKWVSETTIEDTMDTVLRYNMLPLINMGMPDPGSWNPVLNWEIVQKIDTPEVRDIDYALKTPYGTLTKKIVEYPYQGCSLAKYPVTCDNDLRPFEWVVDAMGDGDLSKIATKVAEYVKIINGRGALDIQWAMQPYEMLYFPDVLNTMLLTYDQPDFVARLEQKIIALSEKWIKQVAKGGADFVFIGGSSKEMVNPEIFEQHLNPGAKAVTDIAHANNLMVYSHVCSPIEPFLTMGYYNKWGLDLFETLSPPPVGNIISMADAITKLDPKICTRGNVGLDVLFNGTPNDIKKIVRQIKQETIGRKHIIAASDYLFYNIPEENIIALCEAAVDEKSI